MDGKIENCLSRNNEIVSTATESGKSVSYLGGFAGATREQTRACVAYGNTLECRDQVSLGAGFCPSIESTVSYCFSERFSWNGHPDKFYSFAPNSNKIVYCYAYGGDEIASKGLPIVGDEEVKSAAWLKDSCKLDPAIWKLADGSLPEIEI